MGSIYKYPSRELINFSNGFFNRILERLLGTKIYLLTLQFQSLKINDSFSNVFIHFFKTNSITNNLTATFSDHLLQFSVIQNLFGNNPKQKIAYI